MTWKDITYKQFEQLRNIAEDPNLTDDLRTMEMVLLLFGDQPLDEMWKYVKEINDLLLLPMPTGDTIDDVLKVNGREYVVTKDLGKITTSQFIDYTNYCKDGGNMIGMLSCFLIPKGHKYDDGYDMERAKSDIGDLSIVTVNNYCFFFRKKWLSSQKASLLYLMVETLKLKGMPLKNKMRMVWAQARLWRSMDYLTTSSL